MQDADNIEIQIHIDEARKVIEFGNAIQRLIHNRDFHTVIDQGYTFNEAKRLTLLLGDPAFENKEPIINSLRAIGEFHQYLRVQIGYAEEMKKSLADAEQYLVEQDLNDAGGDVE